MGLFKPQIFGKGDQQSGVPPDGLTPNLAKTLSYLICYVVILNAKAQSFILSDYIPCIEQLLFDPCPSSCEQKAQVSVSQESGGLSPSDSSMWHHEHLIAAALLVLVLGKG